MARRRARPARADVCVVLDSGAVIALSRLDRTIRQRLTVMRERGADVVVPMVVIAETVRGDGPRDATVNLVLAGTDPGRPLAEPSARLAGRLLAEARRSDTVDALVVAEAIERSPSIIITSDVDDLTALLGDHPGVLVIGI